MPRYSNERKEAVLAKLLLPHSLVVKQVASRRTSPSRPFTSGVTRPGSRVSVSRTAIIQTRRAGAPGTSSRRWSRPLP